MQKKSINRTETKVGGGDNTPLRRACRNEDADDDGQHVWIDKTEQKPGPPAIITESRVTLRGPAPAGSSGTTRGTLFGQKGKKNRPRKGGKPSSRPVLVDVAYKADEAYRAVKSIARMINVEQKFFDISSATNVISTTPSVVALTDITQGDDYNLRTGNSLLVQGSYFGFHVIPGTAQYQDYRIVVVRDKMNQGAVPSWTDVFETASATLALVAPLTHYENHRFVIMLDETYSSCANTVGNQLGSMVKKHQFSGGYHLRYKGTTAAAVSDWQNATYLMYVSNDATNGPAISWWHRLAYTDD